MTQIEMPAGVNAREALAVPAVLVTICGAVGIFASLGMIVFHAALLQVLANDPRFGQTLASDSAAGGFVVPLIWLVLSCGLVLGAMKMRTLQSYRLAVAAAVVVMLPCGGCFCIGLPVGIWALITLRKPEVKSQFQG